MQIINFISLCIIGIYIGLLLIWIWYWKNIPNTLASEGYAPKVSIICVFRNEENNLLNLLQSIENQNYSRDNFELILCNDESTDGSMTIVQAYLKKTKLKIAIIENVKDEILKAKKKYINFALCQAKGDIILVTDADCTHQTNWIKSMVQAFETEKVMLVSAPVAFNSKPKVFNQLQIVEFASLIGTGAACIAMKTPNMCNAANLAFRKSAFTAVGGYQGNETLSSGDDEFLMHKIFSHFPNSVVFQKAKSAIVHTDAQSNFFDFLSQRRRWASKWSHYKLLSVKILALLILLLQLAQIQIVFTAIIAQKWNGPLLIVILKLLVEAYFLADILKFFGKAKSIFFIPLAQLFYPIYIMTITALSFKKSYTWKNRTYSNN